MSTFEQLRQHVSQGANLEIGLAGILQKSLWDIETARNATMEAVEKLRAADAAASAGPQGAGAAGILRAEAAELLMRATSEADAYAATAAGTVIMSHEAETSFNQAVTPDSRGGPILQSIANQTDQLRRAAIIAQEGQDITKLGIHSSNLDYAAGLFGEAMNQHEDNTVQAFNTYTIAEEYLSSL